MATRPTSDRLRESLFNILTPHIEGARFADLYAGTGAVGIEALSRGAAHVTFVESAAPALAALRANLTALKIREGFQLEQRSVPVALRNLAARNRPCMCTPRPAFHPRLPRPALGRPGRLHPVPQPACRILRRASHPRSPRHRRARPPRICHAIGYIRHAPPLSPARAGRRRPQLLPAAIGERNSSR